MQAVQPRGNFHHSVLVLWAWWRMRRCVVVLPNIVLFVFVVPIRVVIGLAQWLVLRWYISRPELRELLIPMSNASSATDA